MGKGEKLDINSGRLSRRVSIGNNRVGRVLLRGRGRERGRNRKWIYVMASLWLNWIGRDSVREC